MTKALVWFRQDLRIKDNPALFQACQHHSEIILVYIINNNLEALKATAQAWWLHHSLLSLANDLGKHQLTLTLKVGEPLSIIEQLVDDHQISDVYWNRCYEPESIQRDSAIKSHLKQKGISVSSYNSALFNEPWEVKNKQGGPFKVFTPYWKQCIKQILLPESYDICHWPKSIQVDSDKLDDCKLLPTKPNWAKSFSDYWQPGEQGAEEKLQQFINEKIAIYKDARNEPYLKATSSLSPHLHFGEISVWHIYREVNKYLFSHPSVQTQVEHFLSELGWREFSYYLLYHFPKLATNNYKPEFDQFPWHDDPNAFNKWKKGLTGYPIVDAGMRELWHTGNMHNRVRMIVASFLIKDLFIDWRQGAQWFNLTLLDADMASNYASWQWVAGSGADAAPYFRIFNPVLQGEKFDPQGLYVKQWVPELKNIPNKWLHQPWMAPSQELGITLGIHYPHPIVEHSKARDLAMQYYKQLKHQQPE